MNNNKNQVKANKFEVAKKQVEKLGISVPEFINDNEKHLYHVLSVESTPNIVTKEFDHKGRIQKFNKESFSKSIDKGDFQRLGYSNLVIFHDPTVVSKSTDESDKKIVLNSKKDDLKEENLN